ncbi:glycosyltransferase [Agrobacterium deltaense]
MNKYANDSALKLRILIASARAARFLPFLSKRRKERFLISISRRKAELEARKISVMVARRAFNQRGQIAALKLALMFPWLSERAKYRFNRSLAKRKNNIQLLLAAGMVARSQGDPKPAPATFSEKEAMHRLGLVVEENQIAVDRQLDRECHSILIVSTHMPTTRHAGGLRILDMIEVIKSRNSKVYIELFVSSNKSLLGGAGELFALVDRVVYAENYNFSLAQYREKSGIVRYFDVVDFQFPQPAETIKAYREIGDRLIFTPMESLIRTECLKRGVSSIPEAELADADAKLEAQICRLVDEVVCVSQIDADCIADSVGINTITSIETGVSSIEFLDSDTVVRSRNAVCFIAYFGSLTNRDALQWYLDEVHPHIIEEFGDYDFRIVGRGNVSDILAKPLPCVTYVGEVDRVGAEIGHAAVGIAPALSGAGFRGKINQYAHLGLPTVATPISANGLKYEHGHSILVSEDPRQFAAYVVELLKDSKRRDQMGQAAYDVCKQYYGWESKWPEIKRTYAIPASISAKGLPSVHAIVPSYQHGNYIEQRLRSIANQEYDKLRITVVDDCSDDNSDAVIQKLQEELEFEYIRNDKNSGTPFSAWEYAAKNTTEDLIWICESDDSCDRTMLPKLVKTMRTRSDINMAYCGSLIIDEHNNIIDTTADGYFPSVFHPTRWRRSFAVNGKHELKEFQASGMVVPNMSSLLVKTDTFQKAFDKDIKKYRLAGDWLFVGRAMQYGSIAYLAENLNHFRRHPQTARAQTKIAQSYAEHIIVRVQLSLRAEAGRTELFFNLKHDIVDLYRNESLLADVMILLKSLDADVYDLFKKAYDEYTSPTKVEDLIRCVSFRRYLYDHTSQ